MRYFLTIAAFLVLAGCGAATEPEWYYDDDPEQCGAFEDSMTERSRHKTPPNAQPVNVYTPPYGPWSGNNQLGFEVPFESNANNRQTVLKMDENGPPQVWTVALGIEGITAVQGGVSVTAEIDFGAGGTTQRVDVDWLEGTVVSFPANAINVQAFWEDIDEFETDSALLRVTVGKYLCGKFNAQKTINTQIVGGPAGAPTQITNGIFTAAASTTFAQVGIVIPKFTSRIRVVPITQTAAELDAFYSSDFRVMTTGQANGLAPRNLVRGSELASSASPLLMTAQSRFIRVDNDTTEEIDFMLIADLF